MIFLFPEINTYIEYNGSHYHHYHPFNKNSIEDINELNKLKKLELEKLNKNKRTQYSIIIYTWTDLDVRKRNIAKKNNLNWIEFFTLNDVKEWMKNQ